jgi:CrcB protein
MSVLMVFLGGGLGSLCRYGIALGCKPLDAIFPYATLIANGLSCIVLGCFVALANTDLLNTHIKLMIMTGFCGGFSTYSTFTNETYQLFENGHYSVALVNIFGNLALCLLCIFIGLTLGKTILNS